jgi:stage II sporulation protein D
MIIRLLIFQLTLFFASVSPTLAVRLPETMEVRLFTGQHLRHVSFIPTSGRYLICTDNHHKILEIRQLNTLTILSGRNGITIQYGDSSIFEGRSITIQGGAFQNSFILVPQDKSIEGRVYDGDLRIETNGQNLKLINTVPLESYVAGTVQSESGFNRHNTFYQVQAVIIRTYALNNLNRHAAEGFHLCDQVHCQAYYGKTNNRDIIIAVDASRGQMVVDQNNRLLNTVYHANCGGQTVNSEDLWPNALSYLRSQTDTFCLRMPGALWEKTITVAELRRFLSQSGYRATDNQWNYITRIRQNSRIHHLDPEKTIHLRRVRDHFALRSTFFSVNQQGNNLVLTGRGYGHGVGLCQEGAMKRAEHGHTKEQILQFYYNNARIITLEPEVAY